MPGELSRKRRARAINITGLSESVDAFKALLPRSASNWWPW